MSYAEDVSLNLADYTIIVENEVKNINTPIFNISERTYVSIRTVAELFGMEVVWDSNSESIYIFTLPKTVPTNNNNDQFKGQFTAKKVNYCIYVDDVYCKINESFYNINDRTYLPLRAVSNLLNKYVDWDSHTKTITIYNYSENILYPFVDNGLYGYMDENGEIVCSPKYSFATDFSDGVGIVTDTEDMQQYVMFNGEMSPKYDYRSIGAFSEGVAYKKVKDYKDDFDIHVFDGANGYVKAINKAGEFVIDNEFEAITGFIGGISEVVTKTGEICYINKAGEYINLPDDINVETLFKTGYFSAKLQSGKEILLDNKLNRISDIEYDKIIDVCDNLVVAKQGNKFGVVNMNNDTVISFTHNMLKPLGEQLFAELVSTNAQTKEWEILNINSEKVIPIIFKSVYEFKNGVSIAETVNNEIVRICKDFVYDKIILNDGYRWERIGNLIRLYENSTQNETRFFYINFQGQKILAE